MERPHDSAATSPRQTPAPSQNQAQTLADLAATLDHTLLRREASSEELERLCREALHYGFRGVCVFPEHLPRVVSLLAGRVQAVSVVGFPGGLEPLKLKAWQAREAVAAGAAEIDAVLDREALRQRRLGHVLDEVARLVEAAYPTRLKAILETGDLTSQERIMAATLAKAGGAAFVKTSTGVLHAGATVEDVALLRQVVGRDMGVKASGGIRDLGQCLAMLRAGADVVGTSASVAIMEQALAHPASLAGGWK